MKLINITLTIFLLLTISAIITLTEFSKNPDIKNFYFKNIEFPDNYSEREKTHMQEVKDLVNFALFLTLIALITSIILLKYEKPNLKTIGKALTIIPIISTLAIIILPYQWVHDAIHLLIFKTDTWLLPANSTLIQTYPLNYFKEKYLLINIITIILGIILFFIKKKDNWVQKHHMHLML
jgi:integral membrane protein (TIGR01906 family)